MGNRRPVPTTVATVAKATKVKKPVKAAKAAKAPTTTVPFGTISAGSRTKALKGEDRKRTISEDEFKVVSSIVQPFTKELAETVYEMPQFSGERALRYSHVYHLAEEMEKGMFLWSDANIALVRCGWDNKLRRVNGKHTCGARMLMDGRTPKIKVTTYKVDTEEGFRRLYSKFDRNAPRTPSHIINIRLVDTPQFEGIASSVLRALAQGFRVWSGTSNPDDVANMLLYDCNSLAHKVRPLVVTILGSKPMGFAKRAPVYGAMFETFHKCSRDSEVFWTSVLSGLHYTSKNDPAKALRDWLMTTGSKASDTRQSADREYVYRACIIAFNQARAGGATTTRFQVHMNAKRPRAK